MVRHHAGDDSVSQAAQGRCPLQRARRGVDGAVGCHCIEHEKGARKVHRHCRDVHVRLEPQSRLHGVQDSRTGPRHERRRVEVLAEHVVHAGRQHVGHADGASIHHVAGEGRLGLAQVGGLPDARRFVHHYAALLPGLYQCVHIIKRIQGRKGPLHRRLPLEHAEDVLEGRAVHGRGQNQLRPHELRKHERRHVRVVLVDEPRPRRVPQNDPQPPPHPTLGASDAEEVRLSLPAGVNSLIA
mmetsp:Transcript_9294/g.27925  ORF Transcript_9294/g.27925 Transcript_9294/m.27925 type:complete len:241 (-) Transcript_9294:450-1172(-)